MGWPYTSEDDYFRDVIGHAKSGDVESAEEALKMIRAALDARMIDGAAPTYRAMADYLAECLTAFLDRGKPIENAFWLHAKRGRGRPKRSTETDHDAYAALMVLLQRMLGSADRAQDRIIEVFSSTKRGNHFLEPPIGKRTLQDIYTRYAPIRGYDRDLLIAMLTPELRKLFRKSLR